MRQYEIKNNKKRKERGEYEIKRDKRVKELFESGLTYVGITAQLKKEGYTRFVEKSKIGNIIQSLVGKRTGQPIIREYIKLPVKQQIILEDSFIGWDRMPEALELLDSVKFPKTIKMINELYSMTGPNFRAGLKDDRDRPIYYKINEKNYKEATRRLKKPIDLVTKEKNYKEYLKAGKDIPSWMLRDPDKWTGYAIPTGRYLIIQTGFDKWRRRFISLGLLNDKDQVVSVTAYRIPYFKGDLFIEFNKVPLKWRFSVAKPMYLKVEAEIIDYETARHNARRKGRGDPFRYFNPKDPKTTRYQRCLKVEYTGVK